jgi:hypothetical protein
MLSKTIEKEKYPRGATGKRERESLEDFHRYNKV